MPLILNKTALRLESAGVAYEQVDDNAGGVRQALIAHFHYLVDTAQGETLRRSRRVELTGVRKIRGDAFLNDATTFLKAEEGGIP